MTEETLNYFKGDDLAANVWLSKYAKEGETTPDDMHKRMAKEFAKIEDSYVKYEMSHNWSDLSEYGKDRVRLTYDKIYELFKDFKYIIPQGSIMATLGTDKLASLSNCVVIESPKDSYNSIMKADTELTALYRRRCGVGLDISNLRPNNTPVKNSAKSSTGAVSFMHRFSNTTREVAMSGRRGALMLTMDVNHPDIMEFIKVKRDLSQVTGANISIKLNDEFMKAVKNDEDYILRFPCDSPLTKTWHIEEENLEYGKLYEVQGRYYKYIKAKEYWNEIIKSAHGVAEPGLLFWDNVLSYSPDSVYDSYKSICTNPCVTYDTLILTDKGQFPIGDLVGKNVNVWNGKEFSSVTPQITGRNQEILKIKFSDGREIKCTPYHKFFTWEGSSRDGHKIDKEAKDLIVGDKLKKYKLPVIEYGQDDEKAYSQGFYSGDGNKNRKTIWLYNEKIKLSKILLGKLSETEYDTSTDSKRKAFYLSFKPESKNYVPINDYSIQSRLDWLAGLIDSDGSITSDKGIQISSTNKKFLTNVQALLTTLGVNSKIVFGHKKGYRELPNGKGGTDYYLCKEVNRILIGAYQVKELIDLGLKTYRVKLNDVSPNRDASRFITVVSIEKQEELEDFVYCFNEPKRHSGIFNGVLTGQCSEIPMGNDSCRLMVTNLYSFVKNPFTEKVEFDFNKFYEINYEAMRLMDDLIDLEIEHIDRILAKINSDPEDENEKLIEKEIWVKLRKSGLEGRRTGLGFTALGDTLAALGLKYDSDEALEIIERIMKTKMESELDCTIDLAILRGTFEGWDVNLENPSYNTNKDAIEYGNECLAYLVSILLRDLARVSCITP